MQMRLTIFYTLMLIGILLITNVSIYLLLSAYNNYQLSSEVDRMLLGIQSSEWIKEVEELEDADENKDDEYDDDDDDEYEDDEKKELDEEEAYEVKLPDATDLIIPQMIKSFSSYFIYSNENELLASVNNLNITQRDLELKSKDLLNDDKPQVLEFSSLKDQYFLVVKREILVEERLLGFYIVVNEVTIAYTTMDNLALILIVSFVFGVFISLVLGYFISGKTMQPIKEAYFLKQRFVADASHELRTPLSIMLLSCDALYDEFENSHTFAVKTILGMKRESIKMKTLVDKLLFLARYDSSSLAVDKKDVDLTNLLDMNLRSYAHKAKEKEIDFVKEYDSQLLVYGDASMLNSVFSILIDNAIKYSPNKGVIRISSSENEFKNSRVMEIKVVDSGPGIATENIEKVFDRFYRVDGSRTTQTGGHGLGLAIAKDIVENHNGRIFVEENENTNTTFVVQLPIHSR